VHGAHCSDLGGLVFAPVFNLPVLGTVGTEEEQGWVEAGEQGLGKQGMGVVVGTGGCRFLPGWPTSRPAPSPPCAVKCERSAADCKDFGRPSSDQGKTSKTVWVRW
jgi:hypothetical protein